MILEIKVLKGILKEENLKITSTETLHRDTFEVARKCQILHQIALLIVMQVLDNHSCQQYSECIRNARVLYFQTMSNPMERKRSQRCLWEKENSGEFVYYEINSN